MLPFVLTAQEGKLDFPHVDQSDLVPTVSRAIGVGRREGVTEVGRTMVGVALDEENTCHGGSVSRSPRPPLDLAQVGSGVGFSRGWRMTRASSALVDSDQLNALGGTENELHRTGAQSDQLTFPESKAMRLTFLGATGTVTGSKYLLEHDGHQVLVDCGLFQGLKQLRLRNWEPFPLPAGEIDAMVLTHAHIDHSGYLPALARQGFRGPVYATQATRELCGLLLPDSGHLQEEDAFYANRHSFSKHHPALPLYTEDDGRKVLRLFRSCRFGEEFEPVPGVKMRFSLAGHILGAASVHVSWSGGSLLFSGDRSGSVDILMRPPEPPPAADYVVIESTYGDRLHEETDSATALAEVINRTAARGGIVVIPAFAVGRAQALLYLVAILKRDRRIPDLPVFLNSPMAADTTEIYHRHRSEHRLDVEQCRAMCTAARVVNSVEESSKLNELRVPAVIISASGMATGGRVVHHLKAFAPDARNSILLAGYQAAGTRGAALAGGATHIKIHGDYVAVRAEVASLGSISAHADRNELLAWIGRLPREPQRVFVTHGEPVAADRLRLAVEEKFHWSTTVPEHRQSVELG